MDVSVILVNYNTIDLLCNTIDSVLKHTHLITYEIIVVDNDSDDDPGDVLKNKYGNKIRLLKLPENIGFGRANNEGIRISRGRNIFFLNPDTVLLNNSIKVLSDYLDNHPDTGIVGGNIYNMENLPSFSFRRFLPSMFWELSDLFFSVPEKLLFGRNQHFNNSGKPLKVAYITGADLMIPIGVLDRTGNFNPDFFLYFEETDLAFRVKKLGLKIMSIPDAEIIHLEGESFNLESERVSHYFTGKLIFYSKNYGRVIRYIIHNIIILTFFSRKIVFTLLLNRNKLRRWNLLSDTYCKLHEKMNKDHNSSVCPSQSQL